MGPVRLPYLRSVTPLTRAAASTTDERIHSKANRGHREHYGQQPHRVRHVVGRERPDPSGDSKGGHYRQRDP